MDTQLRFALRRLEVDNQNIHTQYPILLEPEQRARAGPQPSPAGQLLLRRDPKETAIEFKICVLNPESNPSCVGIHYVKGCVLQVC